MNSLSRSDTGGLFGASVVEVLKPEFFIVAPEALSASNSTAEEIQLQLLLLVAGSSALYALSVAVEEAALRRFLAEFPR